MIAMTPLLSALVFLPVLGLCLWLYRQLAVLGMNPADTAATGQKMLDAQMAHAQKVQAVGLLAGGIAHDFNNLLTAISGFCDLLLLRHRAGDPSFADIMQIRQNANRGAGLVRQLLAFSRQQTLQPKAHDLTDVLADLLHLLRRLIGENIKLEVSHSSNLSPVWIDLGQMEQVLVNLVVNARDAMPTGGTLHLRTYQENIMAPVADGEGWIMPGQWMAVDVEDNGTGIPPQVLSRIFDPFFSTKDVGKGTGLGLSTALGIVRQLGGHLLVDTEVGRGTRFTILLPPYVGEIKAAAEVEAAKPHDTTGTGVVLLVEDEDAVRNFAMRALKHKGYDVLEADSGTSGLEVFKMHAGEIKLLLSDVVMPEMDGPTLYRECIKTHPNLPVIFVSGYTEDRLKPLLGEEQSPNVHFLIKPFSLAQLTTLVKEVLG